MSDFAKLARLLNKELGLQEKILTILSKERVAIVKLNREDVEAYTAEKEKLLAAATELEDERRKVLDSLQVSKDGESPKLADILAACPDTATRTQLTSVGAELKETIVSVKKLNEQNGQLIRQTLGLIASTVAIMSARPDAALPTYGKKAKLSADEDPAFTPRSSSFTRSA